MLEELTADLSHVLAVSGATRPAELDRSMIVGHVAQEGQARVRR